jgi:uncharacterized protein (TIGR03083 family)
VQLHPRYDGPPLLVFEGPGPETSGPMLRQRRRLGELLSGLDDDQWAAPTRCDGWSVRDVIVHLNSTNGFWAFSIAQGQAGTPTRLLDGFDHVASPAQLVDAEAAAPPEVLATYLEGVEALAAAVDGLDAEAWARPAEAPPGHIATTGVVLHALWDAWIHERDIALPLGLPMPVEQDELEGCLVYAAGLGPAFLAAAGSTREGALVVQADETVVRVDVGSSVRVSWGGMIGQAPDDAIVLRGSGLHLVEALSQRAPHDPPVPAEHRWVLEGLAAVFDQV